MINKIISDSSFYNITKSSNSINTNSSSITKSSTVANKYIDTVQQFSNITKSGKSVANTYNNALKDYNSIAKGNNSVSNDFNSGNSATQNVDPDEYNIPESSTHIDSAGVFHLPKELPGTEGVIYSEGYLAGPIYQLRYAEHSTDENPIISARGHDENGKEFTQLIDVNKVNPSNATPIEMTALITHLEKTGVLQSTDLDTVMAGVYGYNELGRNLNDKNNYISALGDSITQGSLQSDSASKESVRNLSKTLEGLLGFMSAHNITKHDNSVEIENAYKQKILDDLSTTFADLSESINKEETNLEDELLKLLDENKDQNKDVNNDENKDVKNDENKDVSNDNQTNS